MQSSWVPSWLELQHVHLDNETSFGPQIRDSCSQKKFDIVLMRQGLCYCKYHSFDCLPPEMLEVSGVNVKGKNDVCGDGPSGTYFLEPKFRNGRPAYTKGGGQFGLYWRPRPRFDWVLEEHKTGFVCSKGLWDSSVCAGAMVSLGWQALCDRQMRFV